MFDNKKRHWTPTEERFVTDHVGSLSPSEIAKQIKKTEVAVKQYMHRKRIVPAEKVSRNLVREILTEKFTNPDYFSPTREFYNAVGISQKRWWDIYYGRKVVTDMEYKCLSGHFGVSLNNVFEANQLSLFDDIYRGN